MAVTFLTPLTVRTLTTKDHQYAAPPDGVIITNQSTIETFVGTNSQITVALHADMRRHPQGIMAKE